MVFFIRGVSGYFNSYFINYCGIRVLEKIRFKVFGKLQRLPISFFHRNQEGDLLSRMISDTAQLQSAILQVSNDLIKQPITFIGAITALIVMAVQREGMAFVLLCLVVIPICIFPIRRIGELLLNKALKMPLASTPGWLKKFLSSADKNELITFFGTESNGINNLFSKAYSAINFPSLEYTLLEIGG